MKISEYISKDVNALTLKTSFLEAKKVFNEMPYSHLPIVENNHLLGSISENDVLTTENEMTEIGEYRHLFDHFHIQLTDNWIDILKMFAASETNILPVLSENNEYLGFYELTDVLHFFNDTPLLNDEGFFLVIEKGIKDYSISEVAQIVESNDAKLIGIFISGYKNDLVRITLKIASIEINDIIQSFRRYGYNLLTKHKEDLLLEELKSRSDYLQKYLNI